MNLRVGPGKGVVSSIAGSGIARHLVAVVHLAVTVTLGVFLRDLQQSHLWV